MPPRTEAHQLLLQEGFEIVKQTQKINNDISEVIDSKELSFLNERDRLDFLDIANDFHESVEDLNQRVNDLHRLTKSVLDGDNSLKNLVKEKLLSLRSKETFKGFKAKCDRFISNIHNNDEYHEERSGDLKNLVAGIASLIGLGTVMVLVVLHCVRGLNFFLSVVEGVLLMLVGAVVAVSAVVNLYFYKRKTKMLKNDIDKLLMMVREYQKKAEKIQPFHQDVNSFALLPVDAIDFVELEESLKGLKEVIAAPSVESESSSEKLQEFFGKI